MSGSPSRKIRGEDTGREQILERIEAPRRLLAVPEIPIPGFDRCVRSGIDTKGQGPRALEGAHGAALPAGLDREGPFAAPLAVMIAIGDQGLASTRSGPVPRLSVSDR